MKNIAKFKAIAEAAFVRYEREKSRLKALGYKSNERYLMLKEFKRAADEAHNKYAELAKDGIRKELDKIISDGAEERRAAARARSPWKQAKYDAKKAKQTRIVV